MNRSAPPECYNHELDIAILRSNNSELATTVQELKKELAILKEKNKYLQEQYFTIHSKLLEFQSTAILPTVDATVRRCIPNLLQASEEMTKLLHLCQIGSSVPGIKGVRTFAVTPHTVNGHVLTNPVINIPRLSNGGLGLTQRRSTEKTNVCGRHSSSGLAGPSRSTEGQEENLYNIRVSSPPVNFQYVEESQDDQYEEPEEDNTFDETRSEENQRLSTIPEESINEVNRSFDNSQIRIYIDRVNVDQINHSRRSLQRNTSWNSPDNRNSRGSSTHTSLVEDSNANESNSAILVPDDSTSVSNISLRGKSIYPSQNCFREFFETLSLAPTGEQPRNSTPIKNKRSPDKFSHSNFVTKRRNCRSTTTSGMKSLHVVIERMEFTDLHSKSARNEIESRAMGNQVFNVTDRKRKPILTGSGQGAIKKEKPNQEEYSSPVIVQRKRLARAAKPVMPLKEPGLHRKMRRQQ